MRNSPDRVGGSICSATVWNRWLRGGAPGVEVHDWLSSGPESGAESATQGQVAQPGVPPPKTEMALLTGAAPEAIIPMDQMPVMH